MPTPPGVTRKISDLYDLFTDFATGPVRGTDIRDAIATVGTRSILIIVFANNGIQLDHAYGFIKCDASGGAFGANLPDAATMTGLHLWIKKIDASANAITFTATNGNNIDGAASVNLTTQWQTMRLFSDGVNWEQV